MVSERLRQLLLQKPQAKRRHRPWRASTTATPMSVVKGLYMGPTGCVCQVSVPKSTPAHTASAEGKVPPPSRPVARVLREERLVMPEMIPGVVVYAAAEDADAILHTRQLPAHPIRTLEWPSVRATSRRAGRRTAPTVRSPPKLACPLAAKQLCARCPWMALGATVSVDVKTRQCAAQIRAALPTFLPYLFTAPGTATGRTHGRDIIVEDDDEPNTGQPSTSPVMSAPSAPVPLGHERQIQQLPVRYLGGVRLPLLGNHLQEVYLPFTPPKADAAGHFAFVPLTTQEKADLARTRAPQQEGTHPVATPEALRALSQSTETPRKDTDDTTASDTSSSPPPVADGLGLCGLATLEQKRLLPLLNEWARQLPSATQACLRGALVLQLPSSTQARQAWSSSMQVTLLMEKDVVGWGPQSPLCGPAHPHDVLSVMEQGLVESVLAAAPLLPEVRVQVGFVTDGPHDGPGGRNASNVGRPMMDSGGAVVGDLLYPEVHRRADLTHPSPTDCGAADPATLSEEDRHGDRHRRPSVPPSAMRDEAVPHALASVAQPIACYVASAERTVETALTVTSSALELYAAKVHAVLVNLHGKRAVSSDDTLSVLPFFRHATALDTACSVLVSALLEPADSRPGGATAPHVWLQLADWRRAACPGSGVRDKARRAASPPGVADPHVGTKRLGEALVSVLQSPDVNTEVAVRAHDTVPTVVARCRRWHRTEGRELPLREDESGANHVAPIIARRRAVSGTPLSFTPDTSLPPFMFLCTVSSESDIAREEGRGAVQWLRFVEATLAHQATSTGAAHSPEDNAAAPLPTVAVRLPPVRVLIAQCTGDGDIAPLLAALETVCGSGIGLPLEASRSRTTRRLRLDQLSTSVIDVDPLAASCVVYVSLDLSWR